MKRMPVIGFCGNGSRLVRATNEAPLAAKHDVYAQKKLECKQEPKGKHFGIHWIKRDRWIRTASLAGTPNKTIHAEGPPTRRAFSIYGRSYAALRRRCPTDRPS